MNGLTRGNPFPRQHCGSPNCPLMWMREGCQNKCHKESITYQTTCKLCRDKQINEGIEEKNVRESVYEGETSRSLYTRVKSHVEAFNKKSREHKNNDNEENTNDEDVENDDEIDSFMWKHIKYAHRELVDKEVDPREIFYFTVTGNYRDPLTRQLTEMVRIKMGKESGKIGGEKGIKFEQKIGIIMNAKDENFAPYIRGRRQCQFREKSDKDT